MRSQAAMMGGRAGQWNTMMDMSGSGMSGTGFSGTSGMGSLLGAGFGGMMSMTKAADSAPPCKMLRMDISGQFHAVDDAGRGGNRDDRSRSGGSQKPRSLLSL